MSSDYKRFYSSVNFVRATSIDEIEWKITECFYNIVHGIFPLINKTEINAPHHGSERCKTGLINFSRGFVYNPYFYSIQVINHRKIVY